MLTQDAFRRIALGMAGAIERAHMGHPDFRANGRIFATLYPDGEWGMVKLTPSQQHTFVRDNPATFVPASGAWGRQGCTSVRLASADGEAVGEAMTLAWQNTISQRPARRRKATRSSKPTRRRGRR
jgi:hypothetical protein